MSPKPRAHLLTKIEGRLRIPQETENILQEGESDVAIDLGLNGDLDLEVEVQAKLQRFLGGDGSLVGAADELSASDARRSQQWSIE